MHLALYAWTPTGVRAIPLHRKDGSVKAFAWVDEADYARVAAHPWCGNSHNYAHARLTGGTWVRLHRFILGLVDSKVYVDHRNGNKLDCRRSNMRLTNHAGNSQNLKPRKGGTSQYRGVSWDPERGKWKAQATLNYRNRMLGRFDTELEAAECAAEFRREHMPFATS